MIRNEVTECIERIESVNILKMNGEKLEGLLIGLKIASKVLGASEDMTVKEFFEVLEALEDTEKLVSAVLKRANKKP